MNSIVELLQEIMRNPNVEASVQREASALLMKVSPADHPSRSVLDALFGGVGVGL